MARHLLESFRTHAVLASEKSDETWVDVTGTAAHHESRGRGKSHAGVEALPVAYRREARTAAQMREDQTAVRHRASRCALELLHQIRIRQSVKPVPLHALRFESARNGNLRRDPRHAVVKCGIKAGDLRHGGMAVADRLDQRDFTRKMLGNKRAHGLQLVYQTAGDHLRLDMLHAMYDAMADRSDTPQMPAAARAGRRAWEPRRAGLFRETRTPPDHHDRRSRI